MECGWVFGIPERRIAQKKGGGRVVGFCGVERDGSAIMRIKSSGAMLSFLVICYEIR